MNELNGVLVEAELLVRRIDERGDVDALLVECILVEGLPKDAVLNEHEGVCGPETALRKENELEGFGRAEGTLLLRG